MRLRGGPWEGGAVRVWEPFEPRPRQSRAPVAPFQLHHLGIEPPGRAGGGGAEHNLGAGEGAENQGEGQRDAEGAWIKQEPVSQADLTDIFTFSLLPLSLQPLREDAERWSHHLSAAGKTGWNQQVPAPIVPQFPHV